MNKKTTIVITAWKEEKTIAGAIERILSQVNLKDTRVILVAPDRPTLDAVEAYQGKIDTIQDRQKGKPAALNLVLEQVDSEIIVLTDGDVLLEKNTIDYLLKKLDDPRVGAVSGRPVPTNPKDNLFGFWGYVLTQSADYWRRQGQGDCSGYLYAFRRKLVGKIPEEHLAEDAYISRQVSVRGYSIAYAPEAVVYFKYPDNFSDWIKQKTRSVGGARSFIKELK
ncbi:MAG: glycosyltransferase, partial [Patescibacteria group bacterium]